jgi:CheY-like chemotaxis protein
MGSSQIVLVVDDTESVLTLLERQLSDAGYEVLLADSGEAALQLLSGRETMVDLVITDLLMPGMGGKLFGDEVRTLTPPPPVLYMSAFSPPAGLEYFIQKPFTGKMLAEAVRRVLEKQEVGEQ